MKNSVKKMKKLYVLLIQMGLIIIATILFIWIPSLLASVLSIDANIIIGIEFIMIGLFVLCVAIPWFAQVLFSENDKKRIK